ncbi:MAG: hypothetical protein LQ337_002856 [Flavoplaca oasis]|nr:MAG: hypothetical protein LQ337_002856 [Flavoplaca oasis]
MPGTPMGMDPRGSHAMELAAAMNHARAGLEKASTGDYFLGAPQYQAGAMRPRSPMIPVPGHESYHCNSLAVDGNNQDVLGFRERARERDSEEQIRRDNLATAMANAAIVNPARFAQVHPMRCEDGSYPPDYANAKTVEVMRVLDSKYLWRSSKIEQSLREIVTD